MIILKTKQGRSIVFIDDGEFVYWLTYISFQRMSDQTVYTFSLKDPTGMETGITLTYPGESKHIFFGQHKVSLRVRTSNQKTVHLAIDSPKITVLRDKVYLRIRKEADDEKVFS